VPDDLIGPPPTGWGLSALAVGNHAAAEPENAANAHHRESFGRILAAAYKQVPLFEANVQQGLRNNVLGTLTLARAANEAGVETCVLISTDKAVRPTHVMGASKRVAGLVFQAAALRSPRTVYRVVRLAMCWARRAQWCRCSGGRSNKAARSPSPTRTKSATSC
jgi:nucleoside-diphosphate-sugar epimerase